MGYDISVRFKSTAERDRMFDFLEGQDWPYLFAAVPHEQQLQVFLGLLRRKTIQPHPTGCLVF